uniref:HEAT repeat-containing protein 1 n=1 Tax=Megaselia scalaris TaxID=36166 RepID=T1H3G1_MEGSC
MGSVWFEKNLNTFFVHILELVANPKAASSHVDAVYSRKCINFILRSVTGKMLGEKAQTSACKELILIIAKQMKSIDFTPENAKDSNQETLFSQHLLVCALQELGCLTLGLGTTTQNLINDTEELLRSASQNSRMSLHRTQAGWLLIGAIMTLGSPVVKNLLPRLLLLWRNSFPKTTKDLESEKARGDSFTWQVTLEGRAGALSVMHSFLQNCNDLVTDDIIKKIFSPIESALAMLVK